MLTRLFIKLLGQDFTASHIKLAECCAFFICSIDLSYQLFVKVFLVGFMKLNIF